MPDSEAITYTTLRLISAFGAWFGANPRAVPTVMDFVLKGMMDGAFRLIRKEKKGGGGGGMCVHSVVGVWLAVPGLGRWDFRVQRLS